MLLLFVRTLPVVGYLASTCSHADRKCVPPVLKLLEVLQRDDTCQANIESCFFMCYIERRTVSTWFVATLVSRCCCRC